MSVNGHVMGNFFRAEGYERAYHKGHVICFQGDKFSDLYMVTLGIVKLYDIDENGSERTISFFAQPDVFPIVWLLRNPPPVHLYYYEALTDVSCTIVPVERAKEFVGHNTSALIALLDNLTQTYINAIGRVQNLEKSHLLERLEFVLYWLAHRIGTIDGDVARIDAIITQEDIARLAGVTRESMSLAISRFGSHVLWRENHATYIDLSKLRSTAMPTIFPHSDRWV